jgi:hypothetical protein
MACERKAIGVERNPSCFKIRAILTTAGDKYSAFLTSDLSEKSGLKKWKMCLRGNL